jgi:hypothetical protein
MGKNELNRKIWKFNAASKQCTVDFKIALQNCKISKVPLENLVQFLRDEGSFYVAS